MGPANGTKQLVACHMIVIIAPEALTDILHFLRDTGENPLLSLFQRRLQSQPDGENHVLGAISPALHAEVRNPLSQVVVPYSAMQRPVCASNSSANTLRAGNFLSKPALCQKSSSSLKTNPRLATPNLEWRTLH